MSAHLVTGGAGFIGSHLCDLLLARGRRVVAVDDLSSGRLSNIAEARTYGPMFTFYKVDVRAEGLGSLFLRHRPEVVVHLAAAPPPAGADGPVAEGRVGIMGLLAVLEAAATAEVRKVVFASSAAAYGRVRTVPIKEAALAGATPSTPGAISKKAAEGYLRFYARARGLAFTSLMLPSVYGPRQDPAAGRGVVAALAAPMLAGERPVLHGDGTQTRDFVFIDDTVNALSLALEGGSGQTLNIGSGVETSIKDLFRMLASATGFKGQPFREGERLGEVGRSVLDATLAHRSIGWRPWTHLEDGLGETVAYLRRP